MIWLLLLMIQSPVISIVADDREAHGGVTCALSAVDGVEVVINRLSLGDYLVDDKLLFERKTLCDLVESIKDGRLFRQGQRMAASRFRAIVILEGTAADLAASRMNRDAIQGALIFLSVIQGIPLLRSRNSEESARLILYTAKQVRTTMSGAIARKGIRPKGKRRAQLQILQGLPGIGPVRARRLLENFGTVQSVVQASAEELTLLPGIGSDTAQSIRWAVGEPKACYNTTADAIV
jgi:ERCC4-type nuclease